MKYKYGVVGAVGGCNDCAWKPKNYKNAQACAAIHARAFGHHVQIELAIFIDYFGDKE